MTSKVFPCVICAFVLLVLFSIECETFIIHRPLGKILFLRKNSLLVSKVILKIYIIKIYKNIYIYCYASCLLFLTVNSYTGILTCRKYWKVRDWAYTRIKMMPESWTFAVHVAFQINFFLLLTGGDGCKTSAVWCCWTPWLLKWSFNKQKMNQSCISSSVIPQN